MKLLMLAGVCCATSLCLAQEPVDATTPISVVPQTVKREIGLTLDPLTKDQIDAGLTLDMIKETVAKELELASISVNEMMPLPALTLRIRTIKVGLDLATFFQLCFMEESMLVRNRAMYHATTWSQSSVLACRPEDVKKEVLDTVKILTQTFARDYNKAMQPRSA